MGGRINLEFVVAGAPPAFVQSGCGFLAAFIGWMLGVARERLRTPSAATATQRLSLDAILPNRSSSLLGNILGMPGFLSSSLELEAFRADVGGTVALRRCSL
jgi:hypothetical protein